MALCIDEEGGMAANEDETEIKIWKWPRIGKRFEPVRIKINENITVRVLGQFSIWLIFRWYYEVFRFPVASLLDVIPPKPEEMGYIQTDTKFTSKIGKELLRIRAIKLKEKAMKNKGYKRSQRSQSIGQQMKKDSVDLYSLTLSMHFLAQDLWRTQVKIRQIIQDWLNYYRTETGLNRLIPFKLPDSPTRTHHRNLRSKIAMPRSKKEHLHSRTEVKSFNSEEICKQVQCLPLSPSFIKNYLTASIKRDSLDEVKTVKRVPRFRKPVKLSVPEDDKPWLSSFNPCPVALRLEMMGEGVKRCKCSNHKVPTITDLEYDTFLNTQMPGVEQILVVYVVSSEQGRDIVNENMLEQLYEKKNQNRNLPCPQSQADSYRLIKYDINTAAEQWGEELPLLQKRHNVDPGMFLMYGGGKLLFADYILNGYSTSSKDLLKQITQTWDDYLMGHHLHEDFKFRPMSVIPRMTVVPNVEPEDGFWATCPEPFDRPLSKGAFKLDKCLQSYDRTIPVTRFIPLNLSQTSYLICEQKKIPEISHIPTDSWMKSCCPFKPADITLGQQDKASLLAYNMRHT
ncbi:uncharacterized protein C3orf20 [Callorhinchus milii]|uniref:uncharacterized protein C3orf20 n=1 Tax=Callorhinchus milii TaxID=7868 RepID=UPI001C3FE26B|nr:uncharacterized protein C3orf20 [Callorhinchus milii]